MGWVNIVIMREIRAKTLLSSVSRPDTWFGLYYNMNLYRGCQHGCIYCDSRSECYGIDNFSDIQVKVNAIELLRNELRRKRVRGTIGTGSMNDPYMPIEEHRQLTRSALAVIAEYSYPVHILTKSDLVLRDIDLLLQISQVYTAVSFTITTADDDLGRKVEPGASLVSERLQAIKALSQQGILTGVMMMPVLPFIEDDWENIHQVVTLAHANGASYIIPSFGMTLRDRQREYYYKNLDRHFPGLRSKYERSFGNQYFCPSREANSLEANFRDLCARVGIETRIPIYSEQASVQLKLL
jgi:DNA repair photolyase